MIVYERILTLKYKTITYRYNKIAAKFNVKKIKAFVII